MRTLYRDTWPKKYYVVLWSLFFFPDPVLELGESPSSQPGIELTPPTAEAWSLSHWTTRELLLSLFFMEHLEMLPPSVYNIVCITGI